MVGLAQMAANKKISGIKKKKKRWIGKKAKQIQKKVKKAWISNKSSLGEVQVEVVNGAGNTSNRKSRSIIPDV